MKRIICVILSLCLLFGCVYSFAESEDEEEEDEVSEEELKEAERRRYL